jgi:hypothetical protein
MIWKSFHEALGPRVVTLYYNNDTGFFSKTAPPATLSVNHESRVEALKVFTNAFASHVTVLRYRVLTTRMSFAPIYVDFSRDLIYLQGEEYAPSACRLVKAMSTADLEQLKYLAINNIPEIADLVEPLALLPQLKRLSIITIAAWLIWDKTTEAQLPEVLFHGPGLGGVWQRGKVFWDWIDAVWDQKAQMERRGKTGWDPAVHLVAYNEINHIEGLRSERARWVRENNGDVKCFMGDETIYSTFKERQASLKRLKKPL